MADFYSVLGVSKDASQEEIKKEYLFFVKAYHPDHFFDEKSKKQGVEMMKKINEAYQILSDPEKRKYYDQYGERPKKDSESGNNTKKHADEVFLYLTKVFKKWENSTPKPIDIKDIDHKIQSIMGDVGVLICDCYYTLNNPEAMEIFQLIMAGLFIQGSFMLSLGAEIISNEQEIPYDLLELQSAAAIPATIQIMKVVEQAKTELRISGENERLSIENK